MMQRILAVTLLLGLLVCAGGCGDDPGPADTQATDDAPKAGLDGTRWRLDTIRESGQERSAPRGNATINFEKPGEIGVGSFCNVGGGKVKVGDGTMEFGAIMMTMRACAEPARARAESALTTVLAGKATYELDGDTLTISKGGTTLGFSAA